MKKELEELEQLLYFLLDKVENCYQDECQKVVQEYLESKQ